MNAQFQVAQASGTGNTNSSAQPRIFKLTKPLTDQAVVVNLGYDQKVQVDFTSIANEKITLVHVGEKLIILFDNKSTVTVEPFFDSRHDAQQNLTVEVAPGRDVSANEFASLFPITTDQSVLPAAGNGDGNSQATGAHFTDASVDPLSVGNPLPLLGQEELGNFVIQQPVASSPTSVVILPTAGFTLSGVLLAHDESAGVQSLNGANDQSNSALPAVFSSAGLIGWAQTSVSEIASSSASFGTSGSGTITYTLSTASGGAFSGVDSGLRATATGNEIFLFTEGNLVVGREGAGGVASAGGAIAFEIYLDPANQNLNVAQYEAIKHSVASDPDSSDGAPLANVLFIQQMVTDGLGNTASAVSSGSLGVSFLDDGPTAHADTDATAAGQFTAEGGNVLTAVGTTSPVTGIDVQGADGAVVVGVAAGNTNADADNAATLGVQIQGSYGKLTLASDGTYSYVRDAGTAGGHDDVFTYTIKDGDGDLSHTTLTISIGDSTPSDSIPAPGLAATTVYEAGLAARAGESAGSNEAANSETTTGTIGFNSPDGIQTVSLGGHALTLAPQTFTDATGSLTASYVYNAATGAGTINYAYTLLDNTSGDNTSASFAVVVTDADGDSAPAGNLVINIVDDVPTAHADTDATAAGQFTAEGGNVLTAVGTTSPVTGIDVQGADGAVVVGVAAGNTNADADNAATLGVQIQGSYGKLTLASDGTYSYVRDAGTAGGHDDVFTYTIKDGDGDLSHTTLTISIGDSTPSDSIPAPGLAATTVYEAGLAARAGESAGSNEAANSETTTGTIGFNSPDGIQTVSLGGHALTLAPQTFTDATGSLTASYVYNAATGAGTINYAYTLLDNTSGDNTSASFAVVVTDADGDSAPAGNLVINIVDDVPTAHADTDATAAGQFTAEGGNVLTAVGTTSPVTGIDVQGADGAVVVGVAAGNTNADADNAATLGVQIQGSYGKLTLASDGTYSYVRDAGTAGGHDDVFTYTIKDGDGDLSHTTLTISIGDSTPSDSIPAPGLAATTVYEAGLAARAGESAGSNEAANSETTTGTIGFNSPDGIQTVSLGGHALTLAPQTFTDATGSLTASYVYNAATGAGTINYAYTLLDNTSGDNTSASFAVVVTDADGDSAPAGNLVINIVDDVPTAHADTDATAAGQFTAEGGNVLTAVGTTSPVTGIDVQGADGAVVVGVAAGNTNADADNAATLGVQIQGSYGKLTLASDGTYSYVRDAGTAGGHDDVFTYTIKDGDGDLSHTTLTISIGDSTPSDSIPAPGLAATTVYEAGLAARAGESAGSNEAANSETTTGTIGFNSPDGIQTVSLGGHALTLAPQTFTDATGSLTASYVYNAATGAGTINYAYTLLDNTSGDNTSASFAVVVTDADGDSAPAGNLVINIVDDVPTAHADTDATAAGQFTAEGGNVLTAVGTTSPVTGIDVQGADGAVVVGVAAGNTNADADNAATLGVQIQGSYGKLTLASDGTYSYVRDAGTAGGHDDVFTYTIKDGDGDLSHTTLTISIGDSTPSDSIPAPGLAATTVYEAGLAARAGESAGSNEAANSETTTGTIGFNSPDGIQTVSLGGHALTLAPQTFTDATGSLTASYVYNAATGAGTINYAYTLLDNTSGDNTSASFAVVVTDADGDSAPAGNLVINIVDDVPTAHADTDATAAGQFTAEGGNVLTAVGTTSPVTGIDVQGADGAVVVGVAAGNTNADADNAATLGVQIQGSYGKLTLASDGTYSYVRDAGTAGGHDDVFTYTIKDGDGDLSHTTLTISIGDSTPSDSIPAPGLAATTVYEAGLAARAGESAGSNEAANSETTTGTIGFNSPDGIQTVSLGGHALTLAPQTFTDATGSLTASYVYNAATGAGTINYAYTLLDNTSGDNTSASFAVVVTDADGDSAPAGNLVINIVDDVADGACGYGCDGCGSVHGRGRQCADGGGHHLAGDGH